jgi:hypothetical protein
MARKTIGATAFKAHCTRLLQAADRAAFFVAVRSGVKAGPVTPGQGETVWAVLGTNLFVARGGALSAVDAPSGRVLWERQK